VAKASAEAAPAEAKAKAETKAAVEAKDSDRMFVAGAEMFKTCKACHAKYVPALQPGAEPVGAPLPDWPEDVKQKQNQFLEGKK
jgi:cytochrome c2